MSDHPALARHRWLLLPLLALSVVLDVFAILTSLLLGEWLTVAVCVVMVVLLLAAYSAVREFRP